MFFNFTIRPGGENDIDANWQRAFDQAIESLKAVGQAAQRDSDEVHQTAVAMGIEAVQYAMEISPWLTGSLATSHILVDEGNPVFVRIDPSSVNPFSDENPPEYGPKVHRMGEQYAGTPLAESPSGGARAFYDATVELFGEEILDVGEETFLAQLRVLK